MLGRVHQVLLSAEHVCNLHQLVIDDAGEVIRRKPVALLDHKVFVLPGRYGHFAENVVNDGHVFIGHLESHDNRATGGTGCGSLLRGGYRIGTRISKTTGTLPSCLSHRR